VRPNPTSNRPKAYLGQSPSPRMHLELSLAAAPDHRRPQSHAAHYFTAPRFSRRLLVDLCPQSHATHHRRAHSLSPPLLLVPAYSRPTAAVFRVAHGSCRHDHVRRPPIAPNAEAGSFSPLRCAIRFPSPSHLCITHSSPAVPLLLVRDVKVRRAVQATGAAALTSPASHPRAVPWHRAAAHQAVPTRSHQSRVDVVRPGRESTAPSTLHLRPSRPCHELCLLPMLLADNSSSNLRRSSGPSPALLPTRRAPLW
jgi:hypothetical protein